MTKLLEKAIEAARALPPESQDDIARATTPYPCVFYAVTDTEIIIHAVRHAARDPSGMPGRP
jgi:hypothetical protein